MRKVINLITVITVFLTLLSLGSLSFFPKIGVYLAFSSIVAYLLIAIKYSELSILSSTVSVLVLTQILLLSLLGLGKEEKTVIFYLVIFQSPIFLVMNKNNFLKNLVKKVKRAILVLVLSFEKRNHWFFIFLTFGALIGFLATFTLIRNSLLIGSLKLPAMLLFYALAEELFFRWQLQKNLLDKFPLFLSVSIPSVFYSMLYLNSPFYLFLFSYLFFSLLTLLYYWKRSVILTISLNFLVRIIMITI